jgi:hypothetical protein
MRRLLAGATAALTMIGTALAVTVALPVTPALALDNGLALTPPMGSTTGTRSAAG